MAKAAPAPAPSNVTATPVNEVSGGANATKEVLAARTETWSDTEAPVVSGTEVVEMDGGLGEQNKAEQIMMALRGDGTVEEFAAKPDKVEKAGQEEKTPKVEAKTEEEPAKPTRKDLLASIGAEKKARALEAKVAELQAQNKALTEGTIADAMRARGLTREQAMEKLVLEGTGMAAADPDPERTALKAKVEALEKVAARAEDEAVAKVVAEHLAEVDVPLVKASKRVPVPQNDGTAVYRSTHDVIAELAEQLWIDDGKPSATEKNRRDYIAPAAELLERALNEEFGPLLAAKGAKSEKAAPAKATVPAVGKRGGPPRPAGNVDPYAGMDEYSRRLAIKREYGV